MQANQNFDRGFYFILGERFTQVVARGLDDALGLAVDDCTKGKVITTGANTI